jgi:dTMP kinase
MLIAFEGGEGSGKSTQARRLAERLGAMLTHEPGATVVGARIREIVLDPAADIDPRAEALLLAADRAQHVAAVIGPALAKGDHVVTDRYLYSSIAYQSFGRGLDRQAVRSLSAFAGAPEADLVLLITVSPDTRATRLKATPDRIESADGGFHDRVEQGFRALAEADPHRWVVIDGNGTIDEVAARVWDAVSAQWGHNAVPS